MKNTGPHLTPKLTLFFALALTQTLTLYSQGHKYIPFPDSAFIWRVVTYDLMNSKEYNYQYFADGTNKIMKGQEYSVVYHTIYPDLPKTGSKRYIRNDTLNKKVYIFPGSSDTLEGVLYDFSLKIGDTTKSPLWGGGGMEIYPEGLVVTMIDSIQLSDGWHHRWHFFENGTFDTVYPMIEGIGGRCGPFESPGVFEYASWLLCAMKESKPFFPNNFDTCELATGITENSATVDLYKLYPNPASYVLHLSSERSFIGHIKIQVYDLLGKEVPCPIVEIDANEVIIDVSETTKGLYSLHLKTGSDKVFKGRFIKSED